MRFPTLSIATVLLVASLLVAGCGEAAPAPTNPPTAPAAADPTTAPEPSKPAAQPTDAPAKVDYPKDGKTIEIIVPSSAGGGTDIVARVTAPLMEKELGIPVQVINMPGGGMQVGLTDLAQAEPDGYKMAYTVFPTALSVYLDPERQAAFGRKDLQPVSMQYDLPLAITVHADSPYQNLTDLLDAAKANPGSIAAGTGGFMATAHLGLVQLEEMTGAEFATVHFNGGAPEVTALLGGHIQVGVNIIPEIMAHVKSGELRAIGLLAPEENSLLPGVKTAEAQGYKVYSSASGGITVPAGTPDEIVAILEKSIEKATNSPELQQRLESMFFTTKYLNSAEYSKFWDEMEAQTTPLIDLARQDPAK